MNLYLRKDGRFESRIPNGKRSDGKRSFLYVLARTKEQCIERVRTIGVEEDATSVITESVRQ